MIFNRIYPRVEPQLHPNQAGFRHKHSTLDHLYKLTTLINNRFNINKKKAKRSAFNSSLTNRQYRKYRVFHAVFIDFSKAFDCAWHDGILFKLGTIFNITGRTWRWIRSFLHGRKFRVISGDLATIWKDILAGVLQGSVLAPLSSLMISLIQFPYWKHSCMLMTLYSIHDLTCNQPQRLQFHFIISLTHFHSSFNGHVNGNSSSMDPNLLQWHSVTINE